MCANMSPERPCFTNPTQPCYMELTEHTMIGVAPAGHVTTTTRRRSF